MIIKRKIQENLEKALFKGKVVIVYGARQVGKTTLVKEILEKYSEKSTYLNCDEIDVRQALTDKTSTQLKAFLGDKKLVVLDEAQRVRNIGLTLKLLVDNFPQIQVLATGSSSFELSNEISEPLTGRKIEFHLYPVSIEELSLDYSKIEINRLLERRIIFGMYPDILRDGQEVKGDLKSLANSYVYKDILQYQNIKNPEILEKLLQALALQIGNEVSYNELSSLVGVDKNTVANYVRILEKAFIIFRLSPFSRNLRNELKKLRKIYFYDTGIRNALIDNFNSLDLRQDIGALWENFLISERIKKNSNNFNETNIYFWRTWEGKEIDLIEDRDGKLFGYEFKYNNKKIKPPKDWLETYDNASFEVVNKENYLDFII